ncbi:MAG: ABC transporter permease subunit [Anaerolineales bacterium]|nr:ABC transporter permease subunit [Anaerolineales bacterium]
MRYRRGWRPSGLGAYYLVLIVLLYVPILLLLLFSVNRNTALIFPLRGLTTEWYEAVLDTAGLLRAARNSLVVAAGSSLVATLLGTMTALLAVRYSFRGKLALLGLAVLPLIVPFVVRSASPTPSWPSPTCC